MITAAAAAAAGGGHSHQRDFLPPEWKISSLELSRYIYIASSMIQSDTNIYPILHSNGIERALFRKLWRQFSMVVAETSPLRTGDPAMNFLLVPSG